MSAGTPSAFARFSETLAARWATAKPLALALGVGLVAGRLPDAHQHGADPGP